MRSCNQQRDNIPQAPLHPWEYRIKPWQRLHAEFAAHLWKHMYSIIYGGRMWLIVVDGITKWPEVIQLKEAISGTTITALITLFSRFGLPVTAAIHERAIQDILQH